MNNITINQTTQPYCRLNNYNDTHFFSVFFQSFFSLEYSTGTQRLQNLGDCLTK